MGTSFGAVKRDRWWAPGPRANRNEHCLPQSEISRKAI